MDADFKDGQYKGQTPGKFEELLKSSAPPVPQRTITVPRISQRNYIPLDDVSLAL